MKASTKEVLVDLHKEQVVQATPGRTVERDVQRKTKKLLQSQNYTEYTSVAHKILKCMNKIEPSREAAMLPGSLPGRSSRTHRGRPQVSSGEPGVRSAVSLPALLEGGRKLL